MKTGVGIRLTSQLGRRKRKPLERSRNPFATTIAEKSVIRTIAVTCGLADSEPPNAHRSIPKSKQLIRRNSFRVGPE
jgi:hypothetical protein